jgi:hypothetical protein
MHVWTEKKDKAYYCQYTGSARSGSDDKAQKPLVSARTSEAKEKKKKAVTHSKPKAYYALCAVLQLSTCFVMHKRNDSCMYVIM